MPKVSRYNHFQPWRDGYLIAYNARSGAVAAMTEKNYSTYQRLVEKLAVSPTPQLDADEQELLKQLEHGRFVYPDDGHEYEAIKFQHNSARYDASSIGFVIAPTMACNMACPYCYEGNKKGRMSDPLIERMIEVVEKQASGLKRVDIGWYGGEPLLAMDIIEKLTGAWLDLGEKRDFEYGASIVTNGYLLTSQTVDRLRELKVTMAQVTLDGPARIHNQKRPLRNGRDSFDTIMENLKHAVTKMGVSVRVNIDRSFTREIVEELLDELEAAGLRQRVGVYFGQLEASSTVCANIADNCYDTADFSAVETEYYRLLLDKGFFIQKLPSPMSTYCMAQNVSSLLVDPDGDLYRCYNHVGDKSRSHGNIADPINYQHPNFLRLFGFNPFEDDTCRTCELLPICMGGCPSRRADRDLQSPQLCDTWKHNLQPMLEIIARSRWQQAQAAPQAKADEPAAPVAKE